MGADAWFTLGVIVVLVVVFVTERVPPSVAMGCAVIVLYLGGVVDAPQAFSGFSNIAPLTVAALYILAGAADITGALSGLTRRALGTGNGGSERRTLARFVFPVVAASGFVANTPLVAMLAPRITAWARRSGRSPSRFLIPLSYAAILGGVITVLGTSTNLVISGLLHDAGQSSLGVFEITSVGLPLALVGAATIVVVTPLLLPARRAPDEDLADAREFTVEMEVVPGSPLVGQTIIEANLRNLQGVYLVEILREDHAIAPVAPDEVLEDGDRLVFAGAVERVIDLQGVNGLVMAEEHHFTVSGDIGHQFYEVVVAEGSILNGSSLKATEFRATFGAAVIAVHRAGHRLGGKLGDLPLRAGDVLLVVAPEGFQLMARQSSGFSVVAPFDGPAPLRRRSARLVELATLALVVLAGTGLVDLTKAAMGVVLALLVLRVITPSEARRSINLDIIAMIAFSFGLGAAADASGLAQTVAEGLVSATSAWGDVGLLLGIALGTLVATELLSNNAAAALMFPVAAAIGIETGIALRPLAIVILLVASCSFISPIGYQTNTMVFGMGGYRFTDFTKVGIPLSVVSIAMSVILVPIMFSLR
jgi:di/tricarboxylate transporter